MSSLKIMTKNVKQEKLVSKMVCVKHTMEG